MRFDENPIQKNPVDPEESGNFGKKWGSSLAGLNVQLWNLETRKKYQFEENPIQKNPVDSEESGRFGKKWGNSLGEVSPLTKTN